MSINASYVVDHIRCGKSARTDLWESRVGNHPGPPGPFCAHPIAWRMRAIRPLSGSPLPRSWNTLAARQRFRQAGDT